MIHKFAPSEYRELLSYISSAAFKVIDWKSALAQFYNLSKNAFDQELISRLATHNLQFFSDRIVLEVDSNFKNRKRTLSDKQLAYEVLDIYFSQLFSDRGIFVDLRLGHFERKGEVVHLKPGSFIHTFDKEFRLGMLAIYEGYYLKNQAKMELGLSSVGLTKNSDKRETEEIKRLLFKLFGDADQKEISFDLSHFKTAFSGLFLHLKKTNTRLQSDFLFFGIYLVTLYLALSKLGHPLDVKKCFLTSWKRNSK